ncbi:MAG: hypothetical protein CMH54_07745 [Myxococcales bacterium]|nr:hypothetical protein [Myxococcales bacterium]|tara:strand:- start:518 stop:778 length:261 start_codon:yes stop_codon:yes gene_type:complete
MKYVRILQDDQVLGTVKHVRIQHGGDPVRCTFEMSAEAASGLDTEEPCELEDQEGNRQAIRVSKTFFSGWAYRATGWLLSEDTEGK